MWTAAGMREANKRGAGGGAGVAARILLDPDPVLVGKHGANIEFHYGIIVLKQRIPFL
jgi:hypothetical protein